MERWDDDEAYTIILEEQPAKGEKIPVRKPDDIPVVKTKEDFIAKFGKPPSVTTKDIKKRQTYFTPQPSHNKKSFIEMAREYADRTAEKSNPVPFMCYWPSYEFMSDAQLNWYFYLRGCLRNGEYITADLSYIFVYIYEIINQINVLNPEDGFKTLINIWAHYRKTFFKLDHYMIGWTSDYIDFYQCDASSAIELLKKENLFLLMPTDMLMDYYLKHDMVLPIELISRFSDYKFYESEFIGGEFGNLFTDNIADVVHQIRNKVEDFEKRELIFTYRQKKIPFQRALFDNKNNIRLQSYLPFEKHLPFRMFITAIVKEFENQLRALKKYRGRLRHEELSAEIVNICKIYAQNAVNGKQPEQKVEITINREMLLALIKDSDEVRQKLIEGNYEYGDDSEPEEPVEEVPKVQTAEGTFYSALTPIQQQILDYLLTGDKGINIAFPGVFVGVEIDKINDAALETFGDLLIGFEDDRWYVIEDYIGSIYE